MRSPSFVVIAASALALSSSGVYGQSIISAHSGVLHYSEGDVTIDGQTPHQKAGTFAEVKEKQELQTQVGRAEVLLTPGVFLRMGENTGIRMDSNKLVDTHVAFLNGSAIVDFVEVTKDNSVKISYQDYEVSFLKKGIYRFDSEPAQLKVYTGEAVVSHGGSNVHLRDGRELPFTPALVSEKFDNRTGDALYRWAKRRSEYIAVANLSAARKMSSGYASTGSSSSWYYNPYYSMFTFIPGSGIMCDPFALYACYYSPWSAYRYYNNYPYGYNGGGGGGYSTASSHNSSGYYPTSIGTSSTLSSYSGSGYSGYSGPSVSSSASSSSSPSSASAGFSGGGASSMGGGGFSGGGGGGGGSHGGGSAGGHGK